MAPSRLISMAESLEDSTTKNGMPSWRDKMQEEQPDVWEAILYIVDDFNSGGVMSRKFKSVSEIHRWLTGRDKRRPIDEPVVLPKENAFRVFVRERAESLDAQKKRPGQPGEKAAEVRGRKTRRKGAKP